ncbi:HNH/ENDO VII superfamily nuclease [Novosphingobium sp. PhB165]|nr:HNH/ENDO VII superfamily nuclease [Novosphingobium sp. PhB165]
MFTTLGRESLRFEDFRDNGLLLPCDERAALRMGLPLHRGPHHRYTELVVERVAQIEAYWRRAHMRDPQAAAIEAQMRLDLLRRALRRLLLARRATRPLLNRHDPLGHGLDFSDLDALADLLWDGTALPARLPAPSVLPQAMPARARSSVLAD